MWRYDDTWASKTERILEKTRRFSGILQHRVVIMSLKFDEDTWGKVEQAKLMGPELTGGRTSAPLLG